MALTLGNFCGFETGGLEEADGTAGAPASQSTTVRSGSFALRLGSGAVDTYRLNAFEGGISDAGDDQIVGFAIRFNDTTPSGGAIRFFAAQSNVNVQIWELRLNTDGNVDVIYDTGAVDTITTPFTDNTFHFVEIRWQHLESGEIDIFIDGTSVLSQTGKDLSIGTNFDNYRWTNGGGLDDDMFVDDVYCMSGATSTSDFLGDAEVFKYQSSKSSATPDDGGDNLNAGQWADCGTTPINASSADYTQNTAAGAVDTDATNGSPEGPVNDSRIQGEIKGMKAVCNMKRSGGGGTDHFILMGNDVDGTTRSADLNPTTAFDNYFFVSETATVVPEVSEHCRIGIEQTGGQDFICQGLWAMLLHVPAPAATWPGWVQSRGGWWG